MTGRRTWWRRPRRRRRSRCLGGAAHWGPSAWGVYLHVDDPTGAVRVHAHSPTWRSRVRRGCRSGPTDPRAQPHHRAAMASGVGGAGRLPPGWSMDVTAIDIVEMDDLTGWRTVERFVLATPTTCQDGDASRASPRASESAQ